MPAPNLDVAAKTVCLTGTFSDLSRSDAETALRLLGATVTGKVSNKTDVLFVGSLDQGFSTATLKARQFKTRVATEAQLKQVLATKPISKTALAAEKRRPTLEARKVPPPAHQDLEALIVQNPADDQARLVFADHLASKGDPRGEFIQFQCSLHDVAGESPRPPNKKVDGADELVNRVARLLKKNQASWLKGAKLDRVRWARGFPLAGGCKAVEFIENPAYDRMPLEGIKLRQWNGKLADAMLRRAAHPTLTHFWFGSGFGAKVAHLLAAPTFAKAKRFDAGFWDSAGISARAVELLGQCSFPDLEYVEGTAELLVTLDAATCPKLRTYRVPGRAPDTHPDLGTTRIWRQLERIVTSVTVDYATLPQATSLKEIEISWPTELTLEDARQLVAAAPTSLTTLKGDFAERAEYRSGVVDPKLVEVLKKRFHLELPEDFSDDSPLG